MVTATNDTEALAEQLSNLRTNTAPPPGSSLAFKYNLFADGDPRHPRPIPRYLFRVYSSHSAGTTSDSIIHSKAACSDNERIRESSKTCIFRKEQRELASEMVFKHLRWKPHNDGDNLISWTSSILFAIVYIFYHRTHYGAPKEDIHLCVIDTKKFKDKTFICDRDLIDVLKKDTADWNTLVNWRSTRLYFGEYLSQGSMGVKGKCVVVSAAQLFNEGLLDTHDDFRRLKEQMEQETKAETETKGKPKTKWALKVCNFRDAWPQNAVKLEQTRGEAIVRVADLFGERWRLPVALSLASLHPYVNTAYILTSEFQRGSRIGCLTKAELLGCSIATTVVVEHERMPEVNELYRNTKEMCSIFVQSSLNDAVVKAIVFAKEAQRNKDISEEGHQKIKRRITEIIEILKAAG